jgi:integrase
MTDRSDAWNDIGVNIRTWSIRTGEISADGEEDTNNLMRVLNAHPELVKSLTRQRPAEENATAEMMRKRIAEVIAEGKAKEGIASGELNAAAKRPPNPLRMKEARRLYQAACELAELAEKSVIERQRMLEKLVVSVVKTTPELGDDPFMHDIGTHHLSALLNGMSKKASTDGSETQESASPRTLLKKISTLRAFFDWARDEAQATLDDPTAGLAKRDKGLRKAASQATEHYDPFEGRHLACIFKPSDFLAFNNHSDYFWAPLLGLHLGTRLKEIITLELKDIAQHEATGIWYMDVKPEHAKNANSIRRLPIASRLVELGFIEYVSRLRNLGATHLFPHRDFTSPTMRRDPSKNCSRKFGEYLDALASRDAPDYRALSSPSLVFHSFRHTVVTALHDAGTPLSEAMQITGHQAQEHALRTGKLSASEARSVHLKTYTHADRARMHVEYPLARLKKHLDDSITPPLDYVGLRRAAFIVTEHVVKTAAGFKSGWHKLQRAQAEEQIQRLNEVD